MFFVAYDVQNVHKFGHKYVKKISIAKGVSLLEQFGYNLDMISKCVRINEKAEKLYLVVERDWLEST